MATITPDLTIAARQLGPGVYSPDRDMNPVLPPQPDQQFQAPALPIQVLPPDQLPNPRPPRVLFAGLRDPRLRMVRAVPLDVTVEESTVVVCWSEINEFGTGETLSAALDDFASSLRELYWHLISPDVRLGEDLAKIRATVGQYIERRK